MDHNELITLAGVFFGGLFMGIIGYLRKKPEIARHDTMVAGVGMEFGSRLQTDQLIAEVQRCADSLAVLADRKQAGIEAKLDRILHEMQEEEERERERERERGRAAL